MFILDWLLFALAVGVVAMLLMPGWDPGGTIVTILATILLGIRGALVGGFLGRVLEWYGEGNPVGFGLAALGAIAFFIYRTLRGRLDIRRMVQDNHTQRLALLQRLASRCK